MLSCGQKQRIQNSLDELSSGRTTVKIAQHLLTVRKADTIAVIEKESIVEQGSHRQLMEMHGKYAALCEAQEILK